MIIPAKRTIFLSLLAVAGATMTATAQQDVIRGRLLDAETHEKIMFAHIENYSRHMTAITDTNGYFILQAEEGDTLVFSAIGYFYGKAIVADSFLIREKVIPFELTERIYELSEATIHIPGTYKEFKQDFLELKLPETQTDKLQREFNILAAEAGREAYEEALARGEIEPPRPGFTILSADEKARLKLKKVIGEEERQKVIQEKYNVEFVKQVTGLEDEDEILSFMLFCDFDDSYLYEVNLLDLMEMIAKKFEAYLKQKQGVQDTGS